MKRINVLENIGLAVCDEHHVELVQRLVNISDIVLLDCSVLSSGVGELGKRRK